MIGEDQLRHSNAIQLMSKAKPLGRMRLKKFRDAIADLLTDPDWVVIRAEFEAGALRNRRILEKFVEVHRRQIRDKGKHIRDLARSSDISLRVRPSEFIMIIFTLSLELAVTQKLLGAELSQKGARHLIESLFDRLTSS